MKGWQKEESALLNLLATIPEKEDGFLLGTANHYARQNHLPNQLNIRFPSLK